MNSLENMNRKNWISKKEIKYIKKCLDEYYHREFGDLFNEKLSVDKEINLAYTENDEGIPKQVTTIIIKNEFYVYEEEEKIKTISMDKEIYLENLETMDFDWLINF